MYKDTGAAWILARSGEVPTHSVPGEHQANGEIL